MLLYKHIIKKSGQLSQLYVVEKRKLYEESKVATIRVYDSYHMNVKKKKKKKVTMLKREMILIDI
jgi:hypothetical protein